MLAKNVKLFSLFLATMLLSTGAAMAQDDVVEVTDEELRSYIMVMDSVDALRAELSEEISAMIVNHELMDNGRTFNKIKKANGDAEKLEEAEITEEELEAYEEIQAEVKELQAELNTKFSDMVKEHVGVASYNKIRKGLQNDEELKARHEALVAEIQENEGELEEETEGE